MLLAVVRITLLKFRKDEDVKQALLMSRIFRAIKMSVKSFTVSHRDPSLNVIKFMIIFYSWLKLEFYTFFPCNF